MSAISTTDAKGLYEAALALPAVDRAELAEILMESLSGEKWSWEDSDPEWRAAWEAEIRRRIEDVRSGKTQLIDGETVMRELHERLTK